jgi:hypothetical protein
MTADGEDRTGHRLADAGLWQPAAVRSQLPPPERPAARRRFLDWFLREPATGRITVVQWPNPALWLWGVTAVVAGLGLYPSRREEIHWIGVGALLAWGADEVFRGASPARRVLGLGVLGWQVYRLIT